MDTNNTFDKAAWAQQKKAQRQAVYQQLEQYLELIPMDENRFRRYLLVESRFYQNSVGNLALIAAQRPDATRYMTYEDWNKQNISIKKGAQSFSILVPNGTYQKSDGRTGTNFDVQKVFDIAQTNAPATESTEQDLARNLKALILRPPCPISLSEHQKGAVYIPEENRILVGRDQDQEAVFRSLSMALAHAELAKTQEHYMPGTPQNGFYARCASFILCCRYGVDAKEYSFSDMPMILGNCNTKELRQHLSVIRTLSVTLIQRTEKARQDILSRAQKERDAR